MTNTPNENISEEGLIAGEILELIIEKTKDTPKGPKFSEKMRDILTIAVAQAILATTCKCCLQTSLDAYVDLIKHDLGLI